MNRRIRSQWERWYPLLFGVVALVVYVSLERNFNYSLPKSLDNVFSTSTTLSGIVIGFLITAKSILFSIDDKYIIKKLKETNTYNKLINYFMSAIQYAFFLAFISLLGLFLDFKNPSIVHKIIFAIWTFSLVSASSSCYRVIDVFSGILKS
ncbi:MAG: hypothetical protein QNJ42_21895 [Crocosphaera sp.]|nr:hypothetical protein [Crocosphaera sp.]